MAFRPVQKDPLSMYTVKVVTLEPEVERLLERIKLADTMMDVEYRLWNRVMKCKTRENIMNTKHFLSTVRIALRAEKNGFHLFSFGLTEAKSVRNLLTAFRAPNGSDATVKAAALEKQKEFKTIVVDIVRSSYDFFVKKGDQPEKMDSSFLDDQ